LISGFSLAARSSSPQKFTSVLLRIILYVIAVTLDKLFFLAQSKAASTMLLQPFLVVFLIAIAESSDRLNSIPA